MKERMPRSKKSGSQQDNKQNGGNRRSRRLDALLKEMPLAKAVLDKDLKGLERLIESSLPNNNTSQNNSSGSSSKAVGSTRVQNLTLEQSVGEAFTGGRSTPVYNVKVQVVKPNGIIKDRYFVIKLILLLGEETDDHDDPMEEATVPPSLWQKRESYAVERRFYSQIAPTLLQHSTVSIPKVLVMDNVHHSSSSPNNPPMACCWLMTDLRVQYPLHPALLDPNTHMLLALDWLAKFHSLHWKELVGDWRRVVWERGGFWTKDKANKNSDVSHLSKAWLQTCQWMSCKHPQLVSPTIKSCGNRMAALYKPLKDFMKRQSQSPTWSTMIHGDYKAANLFFSSSDKDNGDTSAAAVDFQYTGAGIPAEDVAYLLFPDAFVDYWKDEEELLRYYHAQLMEALILANKGGPSSLPLESFVALYELSRLELLMHWLSKGWVASTDGDAKLAVAIERSLGKVDGGTVLDPEAYPKALEQFVAK